MKKIFSTTAWVLGVGLFLSLEARAQVFTITKGTKPAALTSAQWDALVAQLQAQVNDKMPSVETGQYTKGMANATAMATTGTASVYGSSFKYGLVGGSVALGVDLGDGNSVRNFDAKKVAGFGVQSAAILGFSPGAVTSAQWGLIDPARLRLYLSFLALDQKRDGADVSFASFGLLGQYRLVPERRWGYNLVKWNGVDVASGLRLGKNKFSYAQSLPAYSSTQNGVTASIAPSTATIGADVKVYSVPVEVSTSLRLLYLLNLFGGLGGDFNFGSSKAIADYVAPITVSGGGSATGSLELGGDTAPTAWNLRAFGGVGLEFGIGTLNVSVGKSITASAWETSVGLNLFY